MPRTSDPQIDPCIVFEEVQKTFALRHGKFFKEAVIAVLTRKNHSTHFNAVDDLSFEVFPGEAVAVLGRNGSGKSTTLKLLSGVLRPDSGWIGTQGRVAGLLEVGAGFHPDLTGRDNVYLNAAILGMSKRETDERFDEIVEFAEIGDFIDTEVKRYSSGMYARLGFAVAVHTELDVLLVDEVLSVGDAEFREKCNAKMKELQQQGKTMFIVSHNAGQVKKLCQRGIVLDRGKKVFDGPIDEAVELLNPKPASKPQQTKAPAKPAKAPAKPAKAPANPVELAPPPPSVGAAPQTPPTPKTMPTGTNARASQLKPQSAPDAQPRPAPQAKVTSEEHSPKPTQSGAQQQPASSQASILASDSTISDPTPAIRDQRPQPATPSAGTPAKREALPDTLQARLATMNRLKDREHLGYDLKPTVASGSVQDDEDTRKGPKHGA